MGVTFGMVVVGVLVEQVIMVVREAMQRVRVRHGVLGRVVQNLCLRERAGRHGCDGVWVNKALGGARRVGVDRRGVHGEAVRIDVGRKVVVGGNGRGRNDGVRWGYMVGGMGGVRDMMGMMVGLMMMVRVLGIAE